VGAVERISNRNSAPSAANIFKHTNRLDHAAAQLLLLLPLLFKQGTTPAMSGSPCGPSACFQPSSHITHLHPAEVSLLLLLLYALARAPSAFNPQITSLAESCCCSPAAAAAATVCLHQGQVACHVLLQ
jgi:hypothetical protein